MYGGTQDVNLSFNAEVKETAEAQALKEKDVVTGLKVAQDYTKQGTFNVLSTKMVTSDTVGQIKMVNNYSVAQPLLKTTQLQATNGVIVRTTEGVTVPAGGSVVVGVYPKDPATFTDIPAGNLTIIKLNSSLQDKIYGVVTDKLTTKPREVKVLASSDLKRAEEELAKSIIADLRASSTSQNEVFTWEIVASSADQKVGAMVDTFKLSATVRINKLQVNEDQLLTLVKRKISGMDNAGIDPNQLTKADLRYEMTDNNFGGSAIIKVSETLKAKLTADNIFLDKSNFAGKSLDEVKKYLSGSDLVRRYEVYVSPYWKKDMPKQADRIKITVK